MSNTICQHPNCNNILEKEQKLFCSKSCATQINNLKRVKKERPTCPVCGEKVKRMSSTYCSNKCQNSLRKMTDEELRSRNAQNQSKYRAKGYRVLAPDADSSIIKEIYKNRPEGYEVDHIIPLSKGGLHHQDNLQYLVMKDNRSKGNRT